MNSSKRSLFILLVLCLSPAVLAQRKPPEPLKLPELQKSNEQETIRIETELVQFEVTVTDKQGNLVKDLKREDFEVREDGKAQDVTYFSIGTSARPARWIASEKRPSNLESTIAKPEAAARAGRYFILAVDDLHLAFGNLNYAKEAMHKFVEQQMSVEDQTALITTSGQLGLYQQFTNDRAELARAIDRLSLRERPGSSLPSDVPRITAYQAEMIDSNLDPDALALAVNEIMRLFPGTSRQMATAQAQGRARQIVSENVNTTKATLGTLENIIRGLRGLPGRKSLVLVSDGFLLGGTNQSTTNDLRRITDAANRAGLVIYAIDARGLVAMSDEFDASQRGFGQEQPPGARSRIESASLEAVRDGLNALSRDTGGFPVYNTNDLSLGFKRIVDDTETYYLIAFEPLVSYRDGRFRKLEVRIRNHADYKVRSSKGYFAPDDKALAKAAEKEEKERQRLAEDRVRNPQAALKKETEIRIEQSRAALNSLYPLRAIPIDMSVDFVDSGKGVSYATILAHLDVSDMKFDQVSEIRNAEIEVFGAVYSEKGEAVDSFGETLQMKLKPATFTTLMTNGLIFQRRVQLQPGHYQVRIGTRRIGGSQLGSASAWVEIPNIKQKQFALSSIFLSVEKETVSPLAKKDDRKDERKLSEQPVTRKPTQIARKFKRGEKFDYTVFAYNAKRAGNAKPDVVIQTQIYLGKKLVLATPAAKLESPSEDPLVEYLVYAARLQTTEFEPGTYELRTVVVDRTAKLSAKRSINFTVE